MDVASGAVSVYGYYSERRAILGTAALLEETLDAECTLDEVGGGVYICLCNIILTNNVNFFQHSVLTWVVAECDGAVGSGVHRSLILVYIPNH